MFHKFREIPFDFAYNTERKVYVQLIGCKRDINPKGTSNYWKMISATLNFTEEDIRSQAYKLINFYNVAFFPKCGYLWNKIEYFFAMCENNIKCRFCGTENSTIKRDESSKLLNFISEHSPIRTENRVDTIFTDKFLLKEFLDNNNSYAPKCLQEKKHNSVVDDETVFRSFFTEPSEKIMIAMDTYNVGLCMKSKVEKLLYSCISCGKTYAGDPSEEQVFKHITDCLYKLMKSAFAGGQ